MKRKPLIGVIPLYDEAMNSWWILPKYMKRIEKAGGIPIMLPLTTDVSVIRELAGHIDGLLVTGGQDVDPEIYNEPQESFCQETCKDRDILETFLIPVLLEADKPVLGICRGLQMLNALLGGSLYQDLQIQKEEKNVTHRQEKPYDVPCHSVTVDQDSPLYQLLGKESLQVNSCHHQGIKGLALPLKKMAQAEDGLIEAVYMPENTFVWGLQWHPEMLAVDNEDSEKIFSAFVSACTSDRN